MKADDVEPTRLDAARGAAKAFLADVPEEYRVGVVSFATRAAVGVPPTEDRALVNAALDSLQPGEGTAIGDAVALAAVLGERDKEVAEAVPRSILLIRTGTQDGGLIQPAAAIQEAKKRNVPVYTVLVGTPEGGRRGAAPRRLPTDHPGAPEPADARADRRRDRRRVLRRRRRGAAPRGVRGARISPREDGGGARDHRRLLAAAAFLLVGGVLSAFLFREVA